MSTLTLRRTTGSAPFKCELFAIVLKRRSSTKASAQRSLQQPPLHKPPYRHLVQRRISQRSVSQRKKHR